MSADVIAREVMSVCLEAMAGTHTVMVTDPIANTAISLGKRVCGCEGSCI